MELDARVSNAIHRQQKSRVGVSSTDTAKLIQDKNVLCVYLKPKIGGMQWLKNLLWRWLA